MSNRFANGAKAFGFCDLCGFRFDLKKLKNLVVKTKRTEIRACPACWVPDHPQLLLGTFPIADPQAIRDPRPDTNTWYQSGTNGLQTAPTSGTGPLQEGFPGEGSRVIEWGWAPIGGSQAFDAPLTPNALVAEGQMGTVTVGTVNGLTSQFFTTPGTTSWTAPASVTRALVICVGGGGSGVERSPLGAGSAGDSSSIEIDILPFSLEAFGGGGGSTGLSGAGGAGGGGTTLSATVFGGNGGNGGNGFGSAGGGGGAGGYSGNGGNGGRALSNTGLSAGNGGGGGGGSSYAVPPTSYSSYGGGGVGLSGQGVSGQPNNGGSGGGSPIPWTGGSQDPSAAPGLYGGGAGGTGSYITAGGGGGGGGGLRWSVVAVTPGNSYTVVVGAGGQVTSGINGANGAVAVWYVT